MAAMWTDTRRVVLAVAAGLVLADASGGTLALPDPLVELHPTVGGGGAGLVLADASVVTLALPDLLVELHTTVEGVAAVIGSYTIVLALALMPAERLARRVGPAPVAMLGFAVFAAASTACASSDTLEQL